MLKIPKPYREGSQINVIYTSKIGFVLKAANVHSFIQQAKTFRIESGQNEVTSIKLLSGCLNPLNSLPNKEEHEYEGFLKTVWRCQFSLRQRKWITVNVLTDEYLKTMSSTQALILPDKKSRHLIKLLKALGPHMSEKQSPSHIMLTMHMEFTG